MPDQLPEKLQKTLKTLFDHFDLEDQAARQRQIKTWRRLKFLWDNLQHHYYSEVAHDWRIPESERLDDQDFYDKPINVFRAYLESIIAALSITVPPVTCYPDDADNPLDVTTAKAGDKVGAKIFKDNEAILLWLHSLFIYCTEGMTACYLYAKEDKNYGTYEEPVYEDTEEEQTNYTCPLCGAELGAESVPMCPQCQNPIEPIPEIQTVTKQNLVRIDRKPKTRVCMDTYGGLYVKVPIYARRQEDCLYLIFSYETHFANVLDRYEFLRDKIKGGQTYGTYEQWGRLSPQYRGEYPVNNVTVRNCWFRPSSYNVLQEEDAKQLRKDYPDGVKVVIVNDTVADAEAENLDDAWTLTYNPLSDFIHFDPLGLLLTSIQEITNDLVSLTIQTIEHGIPQTFANPKVLDFKKYQNTEVVPGGVYPATPALNKPLSDGFYEVKTATLSGEVLPFGNKIQELGQVVSGALPSLFGGQVSGSRTASEYSMSRAQALQRLQNVWKVLISWWERIFEKAIPLYIEEMKDDVKDVDKDEMGNFINVFIRKSEVQGKIGKVRVEANENLPITWSQQKDVILQLFELNNQEVLQTLASPENIPYLKKALGLIDYVIPGEDDRTKQYEEIVELTSSEPFMMPGEVDPMSGQPMPDQEIPSVEVDADVDNHQIHIDICRRWLVSDAGRLAKTENLSGYKNVLLHMKMHKEIVQQEMMAMMASQASAMPPKPNGNEKNSPIEGVNNVSTEQ